MDLNMATAIGSGLNAEQLEKLQEQFRQLKDSGDSFTTSSGDTIDFSEEGLALAQRMVENGEMDEEMAQWFEENGEPGQGPPSGMGDMAPPEGMEGQEASEGEGSGGVQGQMPSGGAQAAGGGGEESEEDDSTTLEEQIENIEREIEEIQKEIQDLQARAASDEEAKAELNAKRVELSNKQAELAELESQESDSSDA